MSDEKLSVLQLVQQIDRNRSGTVDRIEFITYLNNRNIKLNNSEANEVCRYLDMSGDKELRLNELSSKLK